MSLPTILAFFRVVGLKQSGIEEAADDVGLKDPAAAAAAAKEVEFELSMDCNARLEALFVRCRVRNISLMNSRKAELLLFGTTFVIIVTVQKLLLRFVFKFCVDEIQVISDSWPINQ